MALLKTKAAEVRAPKGSDGAKDIPGYTEKQKISEGYTPALTTFRDALFYVLNRLDCRGYLLRSEQGGDFCGFNVYYLETPEALNGLEAAPHFKQYRRISISNGPARDAFYAELDSIVAELVYESDNKALKRNLLTVVSDFKDRPANNKSNVSQAAAAFKADPGRLVTLTGKSGLCKVVPPVEWFDPEVRKIDARSLLTLWPDAEAEMLMLILGRIMIGPKDEATAEGYVKHTMRSYGINVGHEPGLGKSTFLGWLIETLEYLGYSTEPINLRLGVFGWGSVAQADLAYVDDLSDEGQRSLMQLGLIKSIVSGHTIKAEEKGLPAESVSSRCVILGCSNGSDPSNFIGMDAGSINRCNQLYTRTNSELEDAYGSGDYRIKQYWEQKSDELAVEPRVLMAWLLRSCVDHFLKVSGHTMSDRGTLNYDPELDKLEATVRALRDSFVIRVNLDHAESLISAILNGCAVYRATLSGSDAEEFDRRWKDTDFSPSLVLACLEHQGTRDSLKGWPELEVSGLSRACYEFIEPKLPAYRTKAATMSLPDLFKAVMGELVSTHGFRYPGTLTFYNPKWQSRKRDFYHLVDRHKNRINRGGLPKPVKDLVTDLGDTIV